MIAVCNMREEWEMVRRCRRCDEDINALLLEQGSAPRTCDRRRRQSGAVEQKMMIDLGSDDE